MAGFLIPDHYVNVKPSTTDQLVASIIWGFTLAVGIFTGQKAGRQTWDQWKRTGRAKAYVWMIWAEWLASMLIGVLSWCFIRGYIAPRYVISNCTDSKDSSLIGNL
jgi:Na+-driven multidrug efflux pump